MTLERESPRGSKYHLKEDVTTPSFADIVGDFQPFASFPNSSDVLSHPTTLRNDAQSTFSNPLNAQFAPSTVHHFSPAMFIDRSFPRHQAGIEGAGAVISLTKSKSQKAKPLPVEEQLRHFQHIHPRERVRERTESIE